jgi:hypothetical protein
MGSGYIDPHFLDLGTSWRWVVSFTPRPLYPRGKNPRYPLDRRFLTTVAYKIVVFIISDATSVCACCNVQSSCTQYWGTILQTGKSRVRFPIGLLDFLVYLILPAALWAWGRLSLTEMSTSNLPGGKWRPAGKADNLTAICEPII